jgi:fumarate reductase subunit D
LTDNQRDSEEARMLTGFILVAFIAALVTFGLVKARRKIGMSVSNKTWTVAFFVTALVILALWSTGHR